MKNNLLLLFISILLILLSLFPFLYLSFFAHPVADDLLSSSHLKDNNLFAAAISEYFHWCGRYVSNFLVLLNPINTGWLGGYGLTGISMILLTVIGIYYLLYELSSGKIPPYRNLLYSLLITLLFLSNMPLISEGIYWFTGAITYQLGLVFLVFYSGLLTACLKNKYVLRSKVLHICLMSILLFLTLGMNEIIMLAVVILHVMVIGIVIIHKKSNKATLVYLLLLTMVCCMLAWFSPGRFIRESVFTNNHRFFYSIWASTLQAGRFSFDWIISVPILMLSILYYPVNRELSEKTELFKRSFYLKPWISMPLLFLVVFIGSFPAYWATGIQGQHRTVNASYFLFIVVWFINLTVFYNLKLFRFKFTNKYISYVGFICIIISFLITGNGYHAWNDIFTGKAKKYDEQMSKRYLLVKEKQDTIFFEPVNDPPKTLFIMDITSDPEHWTNQAYNSYFNIPEKKIILKK